MLLIAEDYRYRENVNPAFYQDLAPPKNTPQELSPMPVRIIDSSYRSRDELLRETSRRLASCVRRSDTVARLGGVIVPLNTWLKEEGLAGIFRTVRPDLLVVQGPKDADVLKAAGAAPPRRRAMQ